MRLAVPLLAVLALTLIGALGTQGPAMRTVFSVVLPTAAVAIFMIGVIWRVIRWARTPVPFAIATTCGQQKSLDWIKPDNLEAPHNTLGVIGRMALEVLAFRSLFRNTRMELYERGNVTYGATKWLWLGAIVFHYCMLVVILRHLRFFIEPVPGFVTSIAYLDGFFEIGTPVLYVTGAGFIAAGAYLLLRRLAIPQLRYVSLANDYFPLFLLIGIGVTGIILRHWVKTDIVAVKAWTMGLAMLRFEPLAEGVHYLFYIHLCLVCSLLIYFPFGKLMHAPGVFLSPTRNLRANSREFRHVNPWDYPVEVHTYDEYEDEFRKKMVTAGIPVERS